MNKRVYPALALAIVGISFASIFIKHLELDSVPPLVIAGYRLLFSVVILIIPTIAYHRKELTVLSGKDWALLTLSGLCLAVHFGAWTFSIKYISIARSVVIVDSQPIFTVIAAWFLLGERVSRRGIAGVLLAMVGIVFITIFGEDQLVVAQRASHSARLGDLLALIGAISITGYVLIGRKLRAKISLLAYVAPLYLISAVLLFAAAAASGNRLIGYSISDYGYFIALAVVPTIFGHTVFNWALKEVSAAVVSVSFLGEPIGATILAFIFFSQIPTRYTVVGGVMILLGIYLTSLTDSITANGDC
ncbi:MAG TPA: DMT family transporter [Blastocatellia bacterium]|nr:DMT family transporter [Blastocatellia bacterium]